MRLTQIEFLSPECFVSLIIDFNEPAFKLYGFENLILKTGLMDDLYDEEALQASALIISRYRCLPSCLQGSEMHQFGGKR